MAEKVLRLHPTRGFYLDGGLHLVNPEKPQVRLPEKYVPHAKVLKAIEAGILIDVNKNILQKEAPVQVVEKEVKETPKKEVKKEEPKKEVKEEVKEEEPKPKAKTKKK